MPTYLHSLYIDLIADNGKDGENGINGNTGSLTITASGSSIPAASAKGLRSAVNSGNSGGGGLYDDEGNLIGIVNAKIVYDGVENIGYAIPSNVAVSIAENIIDYRYGTDTERVQRALFGITVSATVNGNTTEITRQYHIIDMMLNVRAGDVVTLKILRGGEEKTVSITITDGCLTAY